jgi:hypothetical protein
MSVSAFYFHDSTSVTFLSSRSIRPWVVLASYTVALLGIENEKERLPNGQSAAILQDTRTLPEPLQSDSKDDLAWIPPSRYSRSVKTRSSKFDAWLVHSIIHVASRREAITAACRIEGVHAPQHDFEVPKGNSSNTVSDTRDLRGPGVCTSDLPNTPLVITL